MILNSIVIENIRSYLHEEVVFPRGITLFEGDIGSGKSTILMAIEFALFGLGSQKAESLLAKKSETGFVILDFSVDDKKYEIKRTLIRKRTGISQDPKNSWIKTAGMKELLSPSELKQRVLQILKFNEPADPKAESRIFRYTIFTPQEAMKEVLFDPVKRLETIRKAFGIEDYSIADSNANNVLAEIKTKIEVLQVKSSGISELESQISESIKLISEINGDISKKQTEAKVLQSQEKEENNELQNLREKNNEKIKLESRKGNLNEKIEAENTRIKDREKDLAQFEIELKNNDERMRKLIQIKMPDTAKSIPDLVSEIRKFQKISNELIRLESEENSISSDISRLKENLEGEIDTDNESIQNKLDGLIQEKKSLEKSFAEIKEKLEKVKDRRVQKETLKNSLEKEISKFTSLGSVCPTCKQPIADSHHHSLIDEKKKEAGVLTVELQSITDSFFESNSKYKEIQVKIESDEQEIRHMLKIIPGIKEYQRKTVEISQIEVKIRELKGSFSEFGGKNPAEYLTGIKDDLTSYENAAEQLRQAADAKQKVEKLIGNYKVEIKAAKSQISQSETELKQIQLELVESFGDLEGEIASKDKSVDSLRVGISRISSIVAASQEKLNNETLKIKQNKLGVEESKKWRIKHGKFVQFQEWLEAFFIPAIAQIEKQVLLSILQNFNETYTRWYSILVDDPTKESRIDENFTPIVTQDGYEQEVGFLSGGEKTSIALAHRLTLNSLMKKETKTGKSNLLILDEPTDGFSKNQLNKIREVLDELKSEQVVLVSHEKELETYVDNIFQISKENGLSKISRMS